MDGQSRIISEHEVEALEASAMAATMPRAWRSYDELRALRSDIRGKRGEELAAAIAVQRDAIRDDLARYIKGERDGCLFGDDLDFRQTPWRRAALAGHAAMAAIAIARANPSHPIDQALAVIVSIACDNNRGGVSLSNKAIGELLGRSEKSIIDAWRRLEASGYCVTSRGKHFARSLRTGLMPAMAFADINTIASAFGCRLDIQPLKEGSGVQTAEPLKEGSGVTSKQPLKEGSGVSGLPLKEGSGVPCTQPLKEGSGVNAQPLKEGSGDILFSTSSLNKKDSLASFSSSRAHAHGGKAGEALPWDNNHPDHPDYNNLMPDIPFRPLTDEEKERDWAILQADMDIAPVPPVFNDTDRIFGRTAQPAAEPKQEPKQEQQQQQPPTSDSAEGITVTSNCIKAVLVYDDRNGVERTIAKTFRLSDLEHIAKVCHVAMSEITEHVVAILVDWRDRRFGGGSKPIETMCKDLRARLDDRRDALLNTKAPFIPRFPHERPMKS